MSSLTALMWVYHQIIKFLENSPTYIQPIEGFSQWLLLWLEWGWTTKCFGQLWQSFGCSESRCLLQRLPHLPRKAEGGRSSGWGSRHCRWSREDPTCPSWHQRVDKSRGGDRDSWVAPRGLPRHPHTMWVLNYHPFIPSYHVSLSFKISKKIFVSYCGNYPNLT